MKRRRRSAPASTLRAELGRRVREKEEWGGTSSDYDADLPAGVAVLDALLKRVQRFMLVKTAVAAVVVLLAALLYGGGYVWGRPVVEALQFIVSWNMDMQPLADRAIPAFRAAWEQSNIIIANQDERTEAMLLPIDGRLINDYGMQTDHKSGREQMHYGVDLAADEGSPVFAVLDGIVLEVNDRETVTTVILDHDGGWQTVYKGLKEPLVKEGDPLQAGRRLGSLGPASVGEEPHLHFEIRYNGRPVAPVDAWLKQFREPAV